MDVLKMEKRVMFYIGSLASGGAERQLIYTALAAKRIGFDVQIVTDDPACHYENMLEDSGLDLACTFSSRFTPIKRFYALRRIIRSYQPDIIHSFLATKNIWGMALGKIYGVPLKIASIRGTHEDEFRGIKAYSRWADKIICNTQLAATIAQRTYRIPEEKLVVIYNGIDLARFGKAVALDKSEINPGISNDCLVGVTIARFEAIKNHLGLIGALKILSNRGLLKNVRFLLVGNPADKDLFKKIKGKIQELGLSDKIIFLNVRKDIPEILKACDFLVLPSLFEGFPNVLLEAMASDVFTIAAPTGGIPELLRNQENGLLSKGTSPEELAETIGQYLTLDKAKRDKMKAVAKQTVSFFRQEVAFQPILDLYTKGIN